jgi:hypothetical protein
MLENTSAIITSCLPSIRLFIVNIRASTHLGSSRYWHGVASSLKINDQKTLHGPQNGVLPLETMVEAQNGHIVEDFGTVRRPPSADSQQVILSPLFSKTSVVITREFSIT